MKLLHPEDYINEVIAIANRDINEVGFANLKSLLHGQPDDLREWYITAVAKKMIGSGKYVESIKDGTVIITRNPSYVNNIWDKIKEHVIAGVVAIVVSILTILISNRLENRQYEELNHRMDSVEHKLNLPTIQK